MRQLQLLKDRYFRSVIYHPNGHLCHYGDCEVHRAILPGGPFTAPCTCGFNYLLRHLGGDMAVKLNPKYWEEYHRQEVSTFDEQQTDEERAEIWKLLHEALGTHFKEVSEEWTTSELAEWDSVRRVFGDEYCQFLKDEHSQLHSDEPE